LKKAVLGAFSPDLHPNTIFAMWTLHEARNKFSAVVEAALAGRPQVISRRGRPAVVVVSAASYEQLLARARQARGSFVDHLLAIPEEGAGKRIAGRARVAPRDAGF
jgi:antitoxin Phd